MVKPSWLFWVVAVAAVVWNGFAAYDVWMTTIGDADYLFHYDPAMVEWVVGFPLWRKALGAIAAGFGVLGALALLARRRVAVALLMGSFILMMAGVIGHDLILADGVRMYGEAGLVAAGVIGVAAAAIWLYADRAAKSGYLV